jgi:hypothetical protein
MNFPRTTLVVLWLLLSLPGSSEVLVHWSGSAVPPANGLGMRHLVISWNDSVLPLLKEARGRGYQVYVETQLPQAAAVAEKIGKVGAEGVVLKVPESQRVALGRALPHLQSAYPKLRFLVLNQRGKLPQMRGSLVIKSDSVLEVSSPTSQPWIDTNLSLLNIVRAAGNQQTPLYTFSWGQSGSGRQKRQLTATDYALAVAEAGAFHADLVLEVDEHLQKALNAKDPSAWRLWKEVSDYADFYSRDKADAGLESAANVAVVVDDFEPGDEVMNLMARHNLPFKVFRASDLHSKVLAGFDVIIVFAKPDPEASQQIAELAKQGRTLVLVEAKGSYPWHEAQAVDLNEHATSYALGDGEVIELSEAVADPETFAQDIRRLLGKDHALISLWNGLTTIAAPYTENGRDIEEIEFVNYAGDPVRVQVQVKGAFRSIQYESPQHTCCESLAAIRRNGFTEFVIPELRIAGRVHLATREGSGSEGK